MTEFMSSDDDAWESACIFYDGDTVHFLETFVNDASTADVSESGRAAVALAVTTLTATHVQSDKNLSSGYVREFRKCQVYKGIFS